MENIMLMQQQQIIMIVLLVVAFVIMIVMSIVPRKKQEKEMKTMMDSLKVGAKVLTIGRIVGEVVSINSDNTVTIKSGNQENPTTLIIDRMAIGTVLGKDGRPVNEKKDEKKEEVKKEEKVAEKSAKAIKVEEQIKDNLKSEKSDK